MIHKYIFYVTLQKYLGGEEHGREEAEKEDEGTGKG